MKKAFSVLLFSVTALATVTACAKSNASTADEALSQTVNAIDNDYHYPIDVKIRIAEDMYDDLFIETLSDSVDYLVLEKDFVRSAEVDSLVSFYNIAAAANALQADIFW